jgi:hypothetical protein
VGTLGQLRVGAAGAAVTVHAPPAQPPTPAETPPAGAAARVSTVLTLDVIPEPATRDAAVKAKARPRTADGPLAGRAVRFFFRPAGADRWRTAPPRPRTAAASPSGS